MARKRMTVAARQTFLATLAEGLSVSAAADQAGVHRRRFYALRESDEAFAQLWDEAFEQGTDRLEDEARRRAIEGYDEETYDGKGDLVRRVRKFSDRHLELLLRARRPRVFGNSAQVDLTANVRGKVELSGEGRTSLTDVLRLAGEFGVLDQMGLRLAQVVDGEAEEVAPLGLPGGEAA